MRNFIRNKGVLLLLMALPVTVNLNARAENPEEENCVTAEDMETQNSTTEISISQTEYYDCVENALLTAILDAQGIQGEIEDEYQEVKTAKVCSEANRAFNKLEESYDTYALKLEEVENLADLHEKCYNELGLKDRVELEAVDAELAILEGNDIQLKYDDAKKIADDYFNEYYDLMCHIVSAEAGAPCYSRRERYYVANVIENRVASESFDDNLYDVIFEEGQYEPTWTGEFYNEPTQETLRDMENYLRGRVDTGMPENVVYQALFEQGSGKWKTLSSGQYYCYE